MPTPTFNFRAILDTLVEHRVDFILVVVPVAYRPT